MRLGPSTRMGASGNRAWRAGHHLSTQDSGRRPEKTGQDRAALAPCPHGEEGSPVISVTRLGGQEIVVNAELIQLIEAMPDTHLTLTDGRQLIVMECPDEIVARIIAYRRAA